MANLRAAYYRHSIYLSKIASQSIPWMTELGKYLLRRSVNKSEISRKTGISKARLSELTINFSTKLRADELYLIALAINADPCEIFTEVCGHLKLES